MKRTPFQKKPYDWKRSPMKRTRDKPRTTKGLFKDLKHEKKGLFEKKISKEAEWNEIREELRERFTRAGIVKCELNWQKCTEAANFGFTWSFAHSLKRNDISIIPETREVEIREVLYACGTCHAALERIGNKERFDNKPKMKDIVRKVILERKIQP